MSLFFPERRALFLHIPRTGGASCGKSMKDCGILFDKQTKVGFPPRVLGHRHVFLCHYPPKFLEQIEYIFTFVRNPFDYYVSTWRFIARKNLTCPRRMRRLQRNRNLTVDSEAVLRWKPDFDEWLDEMLEEEPGWVTRWYERYVGPPCSEFCHFIGRTETLEEDMRVAMETIGYKEEWEEGQRKQTTFRRDNRIMEDKAPLIELTSEQRERIGRGERVMLRRFYGGKTFKKRVYRNKQGEPV